MQRLVNGFYMAAAIAAISVLYQVNLMAVGTGSNYCSTCWTYWGDRYWAGALFCALSGC